jgi:hypothetical protein
MPCPGCVGCVSERGVRQCVKDVYISWCAKGVVDGVNDGVSIDRTGCMMMH